MKTLFVMPYIIRPLDQPGDSEGMFFGDKPLVILRVQHQHCGRGSGDHRLCICLQVKHHFNITWQRHGSDRRRKVSLIFFIKYVACIDILIKKVHDVTFLSLTRQTLLRQTTL